MTLAASAPFLLQHHHTAQSVSYPADVLPGVSLLYGSLVYKYIFLGIIPVDETISVSHTEPFYCSRNLRRDDLLVPAGRRRRREAAGLAARCAAAGGAALVSAALRERAAGGCWGSASRLTLAVTTAGAGCGSCGFSRCVMVTRPAAAARGSLGSTLRSRCGSNSLVFSILKKRHKN